MIEDADRVQLFNFFATFFNQDMVDCKFWIGKPNSEGVVLFLKAESSLESLQAYSESMTTLASLHLDSEQLEKLLFADFGAEVDPTLDGVPDDFAEKSLQAWVQHLRDLLNDATRERTKSMLTE